MFKIQIVLKTFFFRSGQNALTLATYAGCLDCIKILLTKWTYKNYTESTLLPPLCVAAMKGHLEIVNFFCQLTPPPHLIQSAHGESIMFFRLKLLFRLDMLRGNNLLKIF